MECPVHVEMSYHYFVEQYLLKNKPCLLGEWVTRDWGARSKWVQEDGSPNFTYLCKEFGHAKVSVADCTKCQFSTHPKTEMTLREFVEYWQSHDSNSCVERGKLLYLKDWHFSQQFPDIKKDTYCTPVFMCSDWLDEVWSHREDVMDDYQFVYMGPAGTWTPFHADVLRSYSWSANITGSKEWLFLPPKQEDQIRDQLGNLPFDLTSVECQERIKRTHMVPPTRVIQRAGEIMFVPSGWHHQVRNLEPTISINHNWANAFCLQNMWQHLQLEMTLVHGELQDCMGMGMAGWHQQCQVVLKASAGMDYWEFAQFIVILASSRLHQLEAIVKQVCSSAATAILSNSHFTSLVHFIHKVCGRASTFFKENVIPVDLGSRVPSDHLETCIRPHTVFKELLCELPYEVQQVVEKTHYKDNILTYRSFELCMLSRVAKEVDQVLQTSHVWNNLEIKDQHIGSVNRSKTV